MTHIHISHIPCFASKNKPLDTAYKNNYSDTKYKATSKNNKMNLSNYTNYSKVFIFALSFLFITQLGFASRISIPAPPRLVERNTATNGGTVFISFPLSWGSSWKSNKPNNWDAAWVFAKFRDEGLLWQHVYIDTNSSVHKAVAFNPADHASIPVMIKVGTSNVVVETKADGSQVIETKGLGVFVYRRDNGKGSIDFDSIALKWNYRAQGLDDESVISIRVYAIEMVYVPEGEFDFSDGNKANKCLFYRTDTKEVLGYQAPVRRTDGYWNQPSPTMNSIIASGPMTVANTTYPTGGMKIPSTASNYPPANWYLDRFYANTPNQMDVRKTWNQGDQGWHTANIFGLRTWGGTYHVSSVLNKWSTIQIKFPQPFRVTDFTFGWWINFSIQYYSVRASNNGEDWITIVGNYRDPICPKGCGGGNNGIHLTVPSAQSQAYLWYEWDFYVNNTGDDPTHLPLCGWGFADRTPGGHPDNCWYYYQECPLVPSDTLLSQHYPGTMPIKYNVGEKTFTSSPTYPNGKASFYMMKHELSQEAYVDFLNTLTPAQQSSRAGAAKPILAANSFFSPVANCRQSVAVRTTSTGSPAIYGNLVTTSPSQWNPSTNAGNIAMVYLNWADNAAYLCWAGLRPLTELEYEKACRGDRSAVLGEYAWGTSNAVLHTSLTDPNLAKELAAPSGANFIQWLGGYESKFPARVGLLATPTSNRTQAGAGYYGALNLSDNVAEIYVNVSTAEGIAFSGEHGNGNLNGNGDADIATWPATTGEGAGIRGAFPSRSAGRTGTSNAQVSNRTYAEDNGSISAASGTHFIGCRGGRTAPK